MKKLTLFLGVITATVLLFAYSAFAASGFETVITEKDGSTHTEKGIVEVGGVRGKINERA